MAVIKCYATSCRFSKDGNCTLNSVAITPFKIEEGTGKIIHHAECNSFWNVEGKEE